MLLHFAIDLLLFFNSSLEKSLRLGCNIILTMEQSASPYFDRFIEMDRFLRAQGMLVKYSRVWAW